ncbi:hypothetical protein [Acinetobacter silvestris]|uniref:Signal peptide-containing protein n=1 Tax=Acinetobacter silvestris TaxID=1977882 RepID=A0A1Y3CMK8_9GAMM|nr:hypothetical protein [Acinetobacter silvestris]OTG67113.1 hypothetical protein B9T28_00240 [Acinetobacter silvestris]
MTNIYGILLTAIALTACSTTPTNPNTPIVLEQHTNISAEPSTKHNLARLIKQKDNCVIEFTGKFETGKATEHWIFKGEQLISVVSNVNATIETKQTIFDVQNPEQQSNFSMLKKNFKHSNLKQCD